MTDGRGDRAGGGDKAVASSFALLAAYRSHGGDRCIQSQCLVGVRRRENIRWGYVYGRGIEREMEGTGREGWLGRREQDRLRRNGLSERESGEEHG
jgi:hypothetical protein